MQTAEIVVLHHGEQHPVLKVLTILRVQEELEKLYSRVLEDMEGAVLGHGLENLFMCQVLVLSQQI